MAARTSGPDNELFLRLQAQAGLRATELSEFRAVTLSPGATTMFIKMKTKSIRYFPLQGRLLSLVESGELVLGPTNPQAHKNWAGSLKWIARSSNVSVSPRLLRVSCAAYRMAQVSNWSQVAGEMGTFNNAFFRPFCASKVPREAAENWFSL